MGVVLTAKASHAHRLAQRQTAHADAGLDIDEDQGFAGTDIDGELEAVRGVAQPRTAAPLLRTLSSLCLGGIFVPERPAALARRPCASPGPPCQESGKEAG